MAEKPNGVYVEVAAEEEEEQQQQGMPEKRRVNLYEVVQGIVSPVLFPEHGNTAPLLHRIKTSLSRNVPLIPEASRNTAQDILLWTRAGTPLRLLLVISVSIHSPNSPSFSLNFSYNKILM